MHAYLDCWRASGGFTDLFGSRDVAEALRENVADVVLPWPVIDRVPVAECDDGRLVKSFPVEFPMGQGDLHQPRLRSDFSAADYVQHKFRYLAQAVLLEIASLVLGDQELSRAPLRLSL